MNLAVFLNLVFLKITSLKIVFSKPTNLLNLVRLKFAFPLISQLINLSFSLKIVSSNKISFSKIQAPLKIKLKFTISFEKLKSPKNLQFSNTTSIFFSVILLNIFTFSLSSLFKRK
jgi:hypothetical protein